MTREIRTVKSETHLDVLFAPAEFAALAHRDLTETTCVVFDVLRATTTMVTALANGAKGVLPVAEISDALALRSKDANLLLAGEREGFRINSSQTGSIEFDLGNSPREFTPEGVSGRTIVSTTTNGTRALRACAHSKAVLIGSFLNLSSLADWIRGHAVTRLVLVCAGTHDEAALEDALAAGALCNALWEHFINGHISDSALIARDTFRTAAGDLLEAVAAGRNGKRLLAIPELAADVPFCVQRDTQKLVAGLDADGCVRVWKS